MNRPTIAGALVACALLCSCEKSSPPPPSATPKSQGGLSGLAEDPQSLLGKSAAAGRDTARSIEAEQAQASGMADEISGQVKMITVGGLEFRHPTAWQAAPGENKMRAASLLVAPDAGQGETTCVFLTGIGGSAEDNVERWKKGVTESGSSVPVEAKVQKRTLPGGIKVTTVYSEGTYSSMASGAPKPQPGFGFRGAIVEGGAGGAVFVRLTGPAEAVAANTPAFEQLVFGARKP